MNVFSSPDKMYDGQTQGSDEENNARVLNEAMVRVAYFASPRLVLVLVVPFGRQGGTERLATVEGVERRPVV